MQMGTRIRGAEFLQDINSLVGRVRSLELAVQPDSVGHVSTGNSIEIGSIAIPLRSTLSAKAAAFVPDSHYESASESETKTESVSSSRQVLVTPLSTRLRGGAPTTSETSGSGSMVIIKSTEQFLTKWAALPENEREAFEIEQTSNAESSVVNAALCKLVLRAQVAHQAMTQRLKAAEDDAAAARQQADAAIAAQAAQVNHPPAEPTMKPKPPPSFENKAKDMSVLKWLPVVESYLQGCPDNDYLKMASSFLSGKPRSFWQSKYDLRMKSGPPIDNPPEFFREVMISGYGLKDESQEYWNNWHNLRQKPGEDISEYNVAFEQARTDLIDEIHDEPVLIEKYKSGLQKDLKELARVSPSGKRWTSLKELVEYCTLQWPTIQARLDKKTASGDRAPSVKVAGKRKSRSPSSGRSRPNSEKGGSKFPRLTAEQREKNMREGRCHICGSKDHISPDCPDRKKAWDPKKGDKKFKKGNKKDFS